MIGTISANNDNEIGRMDRGSNAEGPNHQQPLTAFETHNGRWTFAAGTALHAPFPTLPLVRGYGKAVIGTVRGDSGFLGPQQRMSAADAR